MKKTIIAVVLALMIVCVPTTMTTASAKNSYTQYVAARTLSSGLNLQPTGIFEPTDFSQIPSSVAAKSTGITTLILTPDKDMNVTLNGDTQSFSQIFDAKIKGVFVPALRLTSDNVDGFIEMMSQSYYVADIMVISSEISVLKKIYDDKDCNLVNTVYDLTSVKLTSDRYFTWQYVAEANKTYTNVLMFNANDPYLYVAAEYLGAMCKVCWAKTENADQAVSAIADGVTGVVVSQISDFSGAIKYFSKNGFSKAQYVAAHRGITAYANENSLTAVAAAVSEGSTHAEIDIQLCSDGEILLCHNMSTSGLSDKSINFEPVTSEYVRSQATLNDYSAKYGETFPTLHEVIDAVYQSNLILIIELKLEDGRTSVVNKGAIEKFLAIMRDHPEMDGRWFCITFFRPYADQMRELAPEIPVGFLGGAQSGYERDLNIKGWDGEWTPMDNVPSKIAFMHKFKTLLDESYGNSTDTTAQNYLARGYLQNGWTFNDLNHFKAKIAIATSNAAEKCAMAIKTIEPQSFEMTESQLASGKISVNTVNYCGWQEERTCDIVTVSRTGDTAKVLLHYTQTVDGVTYGLYSRLTTYKII